MSDEEKKVVEAQDTCKCCKCCEVAKEFLLRAGAVFVGVLAALLVASLLVGPKPGCPCKKMMNHPPRMERPFYPMGDMHRGDFRGFEGRGFHHPGGKRELPSRAPQDKK